MQCRNTDIREAKQLNFTMIFLELFFLNYFCLGSDIISENSTKQPQNGVEIDTGHL